MTDTKARTADHEAAIIEAARDLMADGGVEAMSMRAVAERVGVSATALYHYFQNKQELVDRVVRSAFQEFGTQLEAAVRRQPAGSMARIQALGEAYVRFAVENERYFRVIFSIDLKDPRSLEELPGGGGYPLLRQCVLDAMASSALRPADPDLVAHYLWSLVHGIVTLVMSCRLSGCDAYQTEGAGTASPLALFHAFAPFVRHGIESWPSNNEPNPVKR